MWGRNSSIYLGVKALETRPRKRLWSGSSTIIMDCPKRPGVSEDISIPPRREYASEGILLRSTVKRLSFSICTASCMRVINHPWYSFVQGSVYGTIGLAARICANRGKGFSAIASPKKENGESGAVDGWDELVICSVFPCI